MFQGEKELMHEGENAESKGIARFIFLLSMNFKLDRFWAIGVICLCLGSGLAKADVLDATPEVILAADSDLPSTVTVTPIGVSSTITGLVLLVLGCVIYAWIAEKYIRRRITISIKNLSSSANVLNAVTADITVLAGEVATSMSEQAASLEQTTASTEEISSMTRKTAENTRSAKELTNEARQFADNGMVHMASLTSGMDSLRRSSVEMTTAMKEIQASSHSISNIMKTVGDIAFQTNILALNAAVEAARAGEAGAGFAVVADEVRSLARHSAEAAQETEKLLEESIKRSEAGARITNLVIQNLEQMAGLSAKVDEALRKINEKSCQVDGVVIQISNASQEQSAGLTQISTALNHMEQMTQANAARARETSNTVSQLTDQSSLLMKALSDLQRLVFASRKKKAASGKEMPAARKLGKKPAPHLPLPARNGYHAEKLKAALR
jgi:methyl-accepting chemotaxis protein